MPYSVAPVIERVATGVTIGMRVDGRDHLTDLDHRDPICAFSVRGKFDALNFRMAMEAGAQFQRAANITAIDHHADRVTTTIDGRRIESRYLIGADGANSVVRRLAPDGQWFHRGFAIEGVVPYAAIGVEPRMELFFNVVRDGYGWLFPKGDHVNVGIYTHSAAEPLGKPRLLEYVRQRLGTDQGVEAIKGFPLGFGGARYTPGLARVILVGDAGGFAEPLLGEGIHNAIKSGQAAADAIVDVAARRTRERLPATYRRRLRPLRKDLARCDSLALKAFYPYLKWLGPVLMRRPSVRSAFLNGFAAGKTMREITGRFLFPPPYQPMTPLSLRQFADHNRVGVP